MNGVLVGAGCGVVPTKHAHLADWISSGYMADGDYYHSLSEQLPRTYIFDKVRSCACNSSAHTISHDDRTCCAAGDLHVHWTQIRGRCIKRCRIAALTERFPRAHLTCFHLSSVMQQESECMHVTDHENCCQDLAHRPQQSIRCIMSSCVLHSKM